MEGLIPYLLHAMKKQRPQHMFRAFSNSGSNSDRSYRLLTSDNESLEGSPHRRTVFEFQAPAAANLFEQRGANEFARTHSRSYREGGGASAGAASKAAGSNNKGFYPYQAANMKHRN